MTRLALAILVAASGLAAAAACGGETETVTVTETETLAREGQDDPAYQLAEDVCGSLPRSLVAAFVGVSPGDSEALAEEFAAMARPELREPAYDGCLAALEDGG